MIAQTFEEWKNCIVNDCNIKLTQAFAETRLSIYENNHHPETQKFKALYGKQHLNHIIDWFKKLANES